MKITRKKVGMTLLILFGLFLMWFNHFFTNYINRVATESRLTIDDESRSQANAAIPPGEGATEVDDSFKELEPVQPMREIDPFDEDAKSWSNFFSQFSAGMVIFDANGDGRLDIYLCQDGRNWTRPSDEKGILMTTPRHQHNCLYLNQGNNEQGYPRFTQVSQLTTRNETYQQEEMLIEECLYPRSSTADSGARPGRQSIVAVAADFDNNGYPDLWVGNALPGYVWSDLKTQHILPRFIAPEGREARQTKRPVAGLGHYFLPGYVPRNNSDDQVSSARGSESMAANSLYLNMGDQDNDGLPEWQDVSRAAGIEGHRSTTSLAVADIDLDGDLDVFVGNTVDPDYWPGGARSWAGAANQLYINQLAETGELKFKEQGREMGVDEAITPAHPLVGFYRLKRIPLIPREYSLLNIKVEPYTPEILTLNGQRGEAALITWAAFFQDVNDDGYPDLWVAHDFNVISLFINERGRHFKIGYPPRSQNPGSWMSFTPADFNGDLKEDIFVANLGAGIYANSYIGFDPLTMFEPVLTDTLRLGYYDARHLFIDGNDITRGLANRVRHSQVLPPDTSLPNNIRSTSNLSGYRPDFTLDTIDPYEFAWSSTGLDVQNDGLPDLYFVGCLNGRGGSIQSTIGTCPGRLLINATRDPTSFRLVDLTAEHHVFNIEELNYDHLVADGYIDRPAPTQNWVKRDRVSSYDRSVWTAQGLYLLERIINQDLIQASENGRSTMAADLNGDGFADLIVRNQGGYDSRSSKATNLKWRGPDGRVAALPSVDHNYPLLTNFEPGRTRVFLNTYSANQWIKIRLLDDTPGSFNHNAIGAKVVVNGKYLAVQRACQGSHITNQLSDLLIGLGSEPATTIVISWPDKKRTVTNLTLDRLSRGTVIVSKSRGMLAWKS